MLRLEAALLPVSDSKEPKSRGVFVLSGMGGVGKSEVAVQFAQAFRDRFWGVFWIDCSRTESIQHSFQQVARALGLKYGDSNLAVVAVQEALAMSTLAWLLILDNCDNPAIDFADYIPSGLRGAVLLTSRLLECERHANQDNKCRLTGLTLSEATDLVLRAAMVEKSQWVKKRSAAELMAETLGCHPLAITLGGAYVSDRRCSLEQYPDVFAEKVDHILHHRQRQATTGYETVYATFEVSVQYLEQSEIESNTKAVSLLGVVAYMDRQSISEELFHRAWRYHSGFSPGQILEDEIYELTTWTLMHANLFLDGATVDENMQAYRAARAILCKLSLAHFDTDHDKFSLHPLVHAWAKSRLDQEGRAGAFLATASLLALSTQEQRDHMSYSFSLQRHLETCLKDYASFDWSSLTDENSYEMLRVLYCCVYQLHVVSSNAASHWAKILLEDAAQHPLTSNISLINVKFLYGRCLMDQRRDLEALTLLEEVAGFQIASTADDYFLFLRKHKLAEAYTNRREFGKATGLLQEIIEIRHTRETQSLRQFGPPRDLAMVYIASGRTMDAIDVLGDLLADADGSPRFTLENPNVLRGWVWLAYAWLLEGAVEHSVEELEKAFKMMEASFPIDHPNLLEARLMLAKAYLAANRTSEAIEIAEDVSKILSASKLHPTAPQRLQAQLDLAAIYVKSTQHKEAGLALFKDQLELHSYLPPGHLRLLDAQLQLAEAYSFLEEYENAAQILQSVLETYRSSDRRKHPDYIRCRKMLAGVYISLNRETADSEMREEMKRQLQKQCIVPKSERARSSMFQVLRLNFKSMATRKFLYSVRYKLH